MLKVILVCDPKRTDFFDYLIPFLNQQEVYILWKYEAKTENEGSKLNYKELFWKNYSTAEKLINTTKPDLILFFEILDLWQISLIVASKYYKVKTYFFEHGVGNSVQQVIARFKEIPYKRRLINSLRKLRNGTKKALRSRIFYFSSSKYLKGSELLQFLLVPVYYKIYLPNEALSKLKFRSRTPDVAVLFNKNNIEPFLLYNKIEEKSIYLGGVPFFDKYFNKSVISKNEIVFIDHPYLEYNILNWSEQHHRNIAFALESFAKENSIKVIIKLHPKSKIENWMHYNLDDKYISVIQFGDITNEMLSAKIILGFSSTLLNALICSKKNVVLLGWHPIPGVFGDDLSKTGLCHLSLSPNDLVEKYNFWINNNLALNNEMKYEEYLKEYNYPFDGNSVNRIVKLLVRANE
jgi:hypothetical protein